MELPDFCNACKEVIENVRLQDFNAGILVTVVGNTWFGTTPEEYDLMSGNSSASVSVVANGVAITTVKEPHPVNVFTVVDAIMLPSFERMDDIYVMKVQ